MSVGWGVERTAIAPAWDWYAKGITGSAEGLAAPQTELGVLLSETASDPVHPQRPLQH